MKSVQIIAMMAAMFVAGAYAAEPAKATAVDKPAAMGDKAMPMQKMDSCEGMKAPDRMKGDAQDAKGMTACKDGMSAEHMQKMHEHMQEMHGGKDGMSGMKSMDGMPQGDAAAKDVSPKAATQNADKVVPSDGVDHAAHHPQQSTK